MIFREAECVGDLLSLPQVTKRETTEDGWFFTYPVDDKIGDQMEPLEPGITSDSRSGRESS